MSVVDDIKGRLDIVETVSGYLSLQKSGRYLKAPCPFHTEKTPSFIVNSERQSWHCFGACATGGDVFSFVMRAERLDFGATLQLLAQKTGITLSQRRDDDASEELYRANQAALAFYKETLESVRGRGCMHYLEKRGVDSEARSKFELGLSAEGRYALKSHLLAKGFKEDRLVEAGLLHRGEDGSTRDFFRDRLMFPIHDRRGRVAGFGARALGDSTPKYLNTSRTSIFDKRGTLYGLHLAADSIRSERTAVVVEGYMDVIAAHQFGYDNVLASMGTALTEQQVSQLKLLSPNIVLALDPDSAGQEATLRSLDRSWHVFEGQAAESRRNSVGVLDQREPMALKIAALPAGQDPDALIRDDPKQWERVTDEAVPLMDFLIPTLASRFDRSTIDGRARVVRALAPMIKSMDPLGQDHYIQMLSAELHVAADAVKASIGGQRTVGPTRRRRRITTEASPQISASPLSPSTQDPLEDYVLALLISRPELKEHARNFDPTYFHKSEAREVFTRCLACSTVDELRDSLDSSLHEHLVSLTEKQLAPADRHQSEAALLQCLQRLERRHLQELQEGLLASTEASEPPPRELEDAIAGVNSRIKELFSRHDP